MYLHPYVFPTYFSSSAIIVLILTHINIRGWLSVKKRGKGVRQHISPSALHACERYENEKSISSLKCNPTALIHGHKPQLPHATCRESNYMKFNELSWRDLMQFVSGYSMRFVSFIFTHAKIPTFSALLLRC